MKNTKTLIVLSLLLAAFFFVGNLDDRVRELEISKHDSMVTSMDHANVAVLCSESAVFVECLDGGYTGSGVVIGPNTIATARHVAEGGDLVITDKYGIVYESINIVLHPDVDCAIVEVDGIFSFYATMSSNCSTEVTDEILAIGSPYGYNYFNTVKFGRITGLGRIIDIFGGLPVDTSDLHGDPGMSGCGIHNMNGDVIGVLVGTYSYFGNSTVFVPVRYIKELLCQDMENEQKVEDYSQLSCDK